MMIITLINYIVKLLCCSHIMSPNSDSGLIAIKKFSHTVVNKSWWGLMDEGLFVGKEVVAIVWIKRYNIECCTAYNIPLRQDSVTLQTCYCVWFTRTSFLNTKKKKKSMHFFLLSVFCFIFLASFLFLGKKFCLQFLFFKFLEFWLPYPLD